MVDDKAPQGVRARMREAIRGELTEAAIQSFDEVGYTATTVGAIAARVGVSERTFFRYFASKEDAVLQVVEQLGKAVAAELATRPAGETTLQALRAALAVAVDAVQQDGAAIRTVMRLNRADPALRRRHLQKQDEWVNLMTAVIESRLGLAEGSPSARLPCVVTLAAFEKALAVCADRDDFTDAGTQVDRALDEVKELMAG